MHFFCFCNWTVNLRSFVEAALTLKSQINVRNFYTSWKERDLLILHEDVHKNKKKKPFPQNHAKPLAKLATILCVPYSFSLFVHCERHKRMTSISYIFRKFLQKTRKDNAKLLPSMLNYYQLCKTKYITAKLIMF